MYVCMYVCMYVQCMYGCMYVGMYVHYNQLHLQCHGLYHKLNPFITYRYVVRKYVVRMHLHTYIRTYYAFNLHILLYNSIIKIVFLK